jgi:hypothetical protein
MSQTHKEWKTKLYFELCKANVALAASCLEEARGKDGCELSAYECFLDRTDGKDEAKLQRFRDQVSTQAPCLKCAQKECKIQELERDIVLIRKKLAANQTGHEALIDGVAVDMQSTIVTSDKLGNGLRAIFLMVCP